MSPYIDPLTNYDVPKELQVGDEIEIRGKLSDDVVSFSVNLTCDLDEDGGLKTVAFQHRFDVNNETSVLTSCIDGFWQEQDEIIIYESPFKNGERFKVTIRLDENGIFSSTDSGSHFYPHKMPISTIKHVTVCDDHFDHTGNVESVESVNFQ
ncbi:16 kDa beta-galactoside-binding lectin-like [Arctopsyche grandis]|uniref:16 kDa beta-galactoside-binding lectin-like n=1 Tax=Arctopsyche grandis TaxID=121162 RepID=UPI00406DA3CE